MSPMKYHDYCLFFQMKNPKFRELSDIITHDTSERLNGQKKLRLIIYFLQVKINKKIYI